MLRNSCRMDTLRAGAPAIICDVDGTLCDVRGIRHFVERPPGAERFRADFARFHSASEDCPPFPRVLTLLNSVDSAGYAIVIVTAREARWADLTERWLDRHSVPRTEVLTRRDLDYRADAVVKGEICIEIQSRYSAQLAIDDREDILRVWAAASIPLVQVDDAGSLSRVTWPGTGVVIAPRETVYRSTEAWIRIQTSGSWGAARPVHVLLSDQRLLCKLLDGGWTSLWWTGVVGLHVDLAAEHVILDYGDGQPMAVSGVHAATFGVAAVAFVHGVEALIRHPALTSLRKMPVAGGPSGERRWRIKRGGD